MVKTILAITSIFALMLLAACTSEISTETPAHHGNSAIGPTECVPAVSGDSQVGVSRSADIPTLFVMYRFSDLSDGIDAWQGVANWFFENEDGAVGGLLTDSAHPLQVIGDLPIIDRTDGAGPLLELVFETLPDCITSRRWVVDGVGRAEFTDAAYSNYTSVLVADTTIYIMDSDNSYVYEVTARWVQPGLESFATYAFFVTNSPAATPGRTPQLYVSFSADGLPTQHFQTLQLSNGWSVAEGQPGYCASSFSPLGVWATGFLADLGWDEDAITFHINGAAGEVKLRFGDNFPPHTVSARRWPAEFAVHDYGNLWFQYESVEVNNGIIHISDDGRDYIYGVEASWPQGWSSYTFRVDSAGG